MPAYRLERDSVQEGFNQSRAKIQIFGGGYANGKTTAAAVKALQCVSNYPGSNGLIGRATYPKLKDTIQREFFRWCPPDWVLRKPSKDDNTCHMINGTVVNFRYIQQRGKLAEDGSSTSNLLSATYDWIIVDQIEDPEITFKDFLDLAGRLRGNTPYRPPGPDDDTMPNSGPRWMIVTSNPTHNWFYTEVVQPYLLWKSKGVKTEKLMVDEDTKEPIIELFESSTYENRANLEDDYIKMLEAMYKGPMRDRYLKGKWAAFEGLVHPAFDPSRHTVTRDQAIMHLDDQLRKHVKLKVIEGYDFGLVVPSCYMFGFVDELGRILILDGFYQTEFDYTEHAEAIKAIRRQYAGRLVVTDPIIADPSIFRRQVVAGMKDTTKTIQQLLSDGTNLWFRPGLSDTISGIAKVNSYLNGLPYVPHMFTGETPGPLFYIVDHLEWFQNEIGGYYWKKNPFGMRIDEPVDKDDHAMDVMKYMISRLPSPSEIRLPQEKLPPQWMFWKEMDPEEYKRVIHTGRMPA
jgi:phage terminase large subunit